MMMNSRSPIFLILCILLGVSAPIVGVRIAGSVSAAANDNASACVEVVAVDAIRYKAEQKFLPARVVVRNIGSRRLVAKLKDPDCRCSFKTDTLRIKPGEEQEFNFQIFAESLRTSTGFSVVLRTNDPDNVSMPLTIPVEGTQGNLGLSGTSSVLDIENETPAR